MNSGLQCLSHISALKDYFLSGKYVHEINKENPLGTKGELSTNYAKLIRALWYGEEACFSPTQLKKAIGIYQPMFSGYSQHDSGELVNYLLDGLHEDLNRVKQKPLVETKDYDGRADEVIAKEAWDGFTKRNQSVIVDLMYGQYKSKLDCPNPNCKHQSIQFDPFLVCSLPIKNNNAKNLELTVVVNHVFSKKVTVCYEVQWNWTMKEVAVELCKMLGFEEQTKILFYVASYSSCEAIEYARTAQFVRKEYEYRTIYARELMPEENPADDIRIMLANVSKHNYSYDD